MGANARRSRGHAGHLPRLRPLRWGELKAVSRSAGVVPNRLPLPQGEMPT
jgi:hypothetical protein